MQISDENILQVSTYYIIFYSLLGIGNIILGNIRKKYPSKRVDIYRWGIIVKSIYILLLVLFKEKIKDYFVLLAIFYGISEALYWSTHGVMNIEIVDNQKRKNIW